jgi:hypothetical protein
MKIIFLILSGYDNEVCVADAKIYDSLRSLSRQYYKKMREQYHFKYYYLEYKEDIEEDVVEHEDYIYIKGTEHFSKIYEKTTKAISYINSKYEYQFVVRTNISSFWNIHQLFNMSVKLPIHGCFTGSYMFHSFISGTGIIMSKDVSTVLSNEKNNNNPDDVEISWNLQKYFQILPIDETKIYYLIYDNENLIPNDTSNILYFRIKNKDRTIDITLFKTLLDKIYNIYV